MIINAIYYTNVVGTFIPKEVLTPSGQNKIHLTIRRTNKRVGLRNLLSDSDHLGIDGQYIKIEIYGEVIAGDILEVQGYSLYVDQIANPDEHKEKWWSYLHENNTIQVKRYFSPEDIREAEQSPFCQRVQGPFMAKDREEAISISEEIFKEF